MSTRYIMQESHQGRIVPRCDLPGSPYGSRRQAQQAARRAGIDQPTITRVRRRA